MIMEDYIETIIENYYNNAKGLNLKINSIEQTDFSLNNNEQIFFNCDFNESSALKIFGLFRDREIVFEYENFKKRKEAKFILSNCKLDNKEIATIERYSKRGQILSQEWFKENKRHRDNLPAVIDLYLGDSWFINGKLYNEQEAKLYFLNRNINNF